MSNTAEIAKLRKQLSYSTGVRRVFLLSKLSLALADQDLTDALAFAREGEELARKLLQRLDRSDKRTKKYRVARASTLQAFGVCYLRTRDYTLAENALKEAAGIFEEVEHWQGLLGSLYSLISAYNSQGNVESALKTTHRAIEICGQLKLPENAGMLYAKQSVLYETNLQEKEALAAVDKAEEAFNLYSPENKAHVLATISYVYHRLGKLEAALSCIEQSVQINEETGNTFNLVIEKQNYAAVLLSLNRHEKSLEQLEEALTLIRECGYDTYEAHLLYTLGARYAEYGAFDKSLTTLTQAVNVFRTQKDKNGIPYALAKLGDVHIQAGDASAGYRYLKEAAPLTPHIERPLYLYRTLSNLLRYSTDNDAIQDYATKLYELKQKPISYGDNLHIYIRLGLGRALEKLGQNKEAMTEFSEALEMARELRNMCVHSEIFYGLGMLEDRAGNAEAAQQWLQRAHDAATECYDWQIRMKIEVALSNVYERAGEYTAALQSHKNIIAMEKGIQLAQANRRVDRLIVSSNVEHLQQQSDSLQARIRELTKELETERQSRSLVSAKEEQNDVRLKQVKNRLNTLLTDSQNITSEDMRSVLAEVERAINDASVISDDHDRYQTDQEFNERLHTLFPALTPAECAVCAHIRDNRSTKDIAQIMSVSTRAIETYRYRIRRKCNIESGADLNKFLSQL